MTYPNDYAKPKKRRGAIAAIIIVIFLFIIGIGAYSLTTKLSASMSTNLGIASEESTAVSEKMTTVSLFGQGGCDPSYPDACIPSPPPDLDCADVSQKRFTVSGSDPHGFDRDGDGVGCES